jgi:multiple sugar transport system ATP-binding protein
LLRIIAGLEKVSAGEIRIGGNRVNEVPPAGRKIAMVFQSYALYPTMTVRRNLSFGLRVRSVPTAEIERRVAWVSELLQIGGMLDRKPSQLSGGQRQRVAIGRALVQQAKVFLLDEPLSNLDAKLRTEMRVELKRLHQSLAATIIYVTHDQIEAMTLATRIAVMRAGRIEQYATPDVLYERPETLFVAGFVGSPGMNFLSGSIARATVPVAKIEADVIPLDGYPLRTSFADGREIIFGIRPEHVSLANRETGGPVIEAESLFIEPMGADTLGWFQYGSQRISARLPPQRARGLSGKVRLSLDIGQVSLFDPMTEQRL